MSILVPNNMAELRLLAASLGILRNIVPSGKGGRFKKEDYIIPIRNRILSNQYGSDIPSYLIWCTQIKSPMLTKRMDELSKIHQNEIWESPEWYFEEKIDGIRCLLIKDSRGVHIVSRFNSRETLLPIELPVVFRNLNLKNISDFILDCELVSDNGNTCNYLISKGLRVSGNTEALNLLLLEMSKVQSIRLQEDFNFNLVFNVFDCLYYGNSWVTNEILEKRKSIVKNIVSQLSGSNINLKLVGYTNQNKKEFYDRCILRGLEGCVAKNKNYVYIADSGRNKDGWIKIKRNIVSMHSYDPNKPFSLDELFGKSEVSVFGDTIDGFITGHIFEGGKYIKSLEVSVYVGDSIRSLGYINNMPCDIRSQATTLVNNIPTLTPMFLNKVVELSSDAKDILRVRYDKSAEDCIMNEEIFFKLTR